MIVILYWYLTNFDVGGVNWPIPPLSMSWSKICVKCIYTCHHVPIDESWSLLIMTSFVCLEYACPWGLTPKEITITFG
jgi:hypothetical protein